MMIHLRVMLLIFLYGQKVRSKIIVIWMQQKRFSKENDFYNNLDFFF